MQTPCRKMVDPLNGLRSCSSLICAAPPYFDHWWRSSGTLENQTEVTGARLCTQLTEVPEIIAVMTCDDTRPVDCWSQKAARTFRRRRRNNGSVTSVLAGVDRLREKIMRGQPNVFTGVLLISNMAEWRTVPVVSLGRDGWGGTAPGDTLQGRG